MSRENKDVVNTGIFGAFGQKEWTAGSWLRFLAMFLFTWVIVYIVMHKFHTGQEYVKLTPEQLKNVVWLIDDSTNKANIAKAAALKATTNDTPRTSIDTTQKPADTTKNIKATPACDINDGCGFSKAALYIQGEFDNSIDTAQMQSLQCYLCNASSREVTLFLTDTKFKVTSYFWLIGGWAYVEVIFWVLIGVLCSLLYYVSDKNRNATTVPGDSSTIFDVTEIPYQIAKFFYAPCCTLVIIFGYSFLQGEDLVDINASKGIIVFSFIGGFYSSRMMNFLDRFKLLFFPLATDPKNPLAPVQKPADIPAAAESIQIELIAAEPTLTEEQKNHLIETGMGSAVVTLQAEGSTEKIKAEKTGEEQQSLFEVKNIAAGKYIIEAIYAGKFGDTGEIINLEATQSVDIVKGTNEIKVDMLKSESDG